MTVTGMLQEGEEIAGPGVHQGAVGRGRVLVRFAITSYSTFKLIGNVADRRDERRDATRDFGRDRDDERRDRDRRGSGRDYDRDREYGRERERNDRRDDRRDYGRRPPEREPGGDRARTMDAGSTQRTPEPSGSAGGKAPLGTYIPKDIVF